MCGLVFHMNHPVCVCVSGGLYCEIVTPKQSAWLWSTVSNIIIFYQIKLQEYLGSERKKGPFEREIHKKINQNVPHLCQNNQAGQWCRAGCLNLTLGAEPG